MRPKLIVHVEGGIVQEIVADRDVKVWLVDEDNIKEGDEPGFYPVEVNPERVRREWGHEANSVNLTDRQLATVLAALRHWQEELKDQLERGDDVIPSPHFEDVEPLTNPEIDELCERLNCG